MFRLLVELFVVANVNGVMNVEPSGQLVDRKRFDSEQSCMSYLNSAAANTTRAAIDAIIEERKVSATYRCVTFPDDAM